MTAKDVYLSGPSLQERFAPESRCFGCGPANARGLQIRSRVAGDEVVASWTAERHHEAFEGAVNGGIIGTLLDCHSNWTAAHHLMVRRRATRPPCTVTVEYAVRFLRPTPSDRPLTLHARIVDSTHDRATTEAAVEVDGVTTATCQGIFVAVQAGHPAYDRW